jgi:3'-5' exonuclease
MTAGSHNVPASRLVVDIETAGYPFDSLDPERQEYLLRFAKTDEEIEQEKQKIGLYPYTAEIVCIGMLRADTGIGQILVQGKGRDAEWKTADGMISVIPSDEASMLATFWKHVGKFQQIITFNGRGFDAPFLHIRSAMLGVAATRNLVPNRYNANEHCDLLDQLTFYGATRKFSLDFICRSFGFESPKQQGITGQDVGQLFADNRIEEIVEYNYRDLLATRELFMRWEHGMRP